MKRSKPHSISSDDECMESLWGLSKGEIGPLIAFLERETGSLHPLVQRELADMLRGTHPKFRLRLARTSRGTTRRRTREDAQRDRAIVAFLQSKAGPRKPAIYDAAQAFGISIREVQRAVKRVADSTSRLQRFMQAHIARQ